MALSLVEAKKCWYHRRSELIMIIPEEGRRRDKVNLDNEYQKYSYIGRISSVLQHNEVGALCLIKNWKREVWKFPTQRNDKCLGRFFQIWSMCIVLLHSYTPNPVTMHNFKKLNIAQHIIFLQKYDISNLCCFYFQVK